MVFIVIVLILLILPHKNTIISSQYKDSLLLANKMNENDKKIIDKNREIGFINLEKFKKALFSISGYDTSNVYIIKDSILGDSLYIQENNYNSIEFTKIFFGTSLNEWLEYKNSPISVKFSKETQYSLIGVQIQIIDSVEYIKIPYEMLYNVLDTKYQGDKNDLSDDVFETLDTSDISKFNKDNLVLIESTILNYVAEIRSNNKLILKSENNQYYTLSALWYNTREHWCYLYDPNSNEDTWRSSYATIELYYNNNEFVGDCDDFAILMCALTKQVGLRYRFNAAFNGSVGHAYAEVFVPKDEYDSATNKIKEFFNFINHEEYKDMEIESKKDSDGYWINLDWGEHVGDEYFNGKIEFQVEDL